MTYCHIGWFKTNGIIIYKQCRGGYVLDRSKTYMQKIKIMYSYINKILYACDHCRD